MGPDADVWTKVPPMHVTAMQLLADRRLRLSLVHDAGGLERPLDGVAVTEQPAPGRWLTADDLVLTSGMWLAEAADPERAAATWAAEVRDAGGGVAGFGRAPWFAEVPQPLLDAAAEAGLTLLSVPPDVPFVAVSRRVSDLLATARTRQTALATRIQQRMAGVARQGRHAVIERLGSELGAHAALVDRAGVVVAASSAADGAWLRWAVATARDVLAASHSSASMPSPRGESAAVTVGDLHRPSGVVLVAGEALPGTASWRAGIVGTAAALCASLDPAAHPVATTVATLLVRGDVPAAQLLADSLDAPLAEELCVAALRGSRRAEVAGQLVHINGWRLPEAEATAVASDTEFVCFSPAVDTAPIRAVVADASCTAGLSAALPLAAAAEALRQAHTAAGVGGPGGLVSYPETTGPLVRRLLATAEADDVAHQVAASLAAARDGQALLADAAAWLRQHGRWDPAAAELGVHRETLRRRMDRLAQLTGLDLDSAEGRFALSVAVGVLTRT